MRRLNRSVSIFSLSALDLLAMATGTFVLLVVVLMPYYRMTFDANAEMEGIRVAVSEMQAEIEQAQQAAAANMRAADEMEAETAAMEAAAARLRAAAAEARAEAARAGSGKRQAPPPSPRPEQADTPVVQDLDLVFVVDASGSMGDVLLDLAQSLGGIVRVLERLVPSLRVGFVAYRDHDVGGWVINDLPLTPTSSQLPVVLRFASGLRPARAGGSTVTEALFDGLRRAAQMPFRSGAKHTIIVIGDAAAHLSDQGSALALARRFSASGSKRSISAMFVTTTAYLRYGRGDREFFAALARDGGGRFTDHQGELMEGVLLSVLED